MKKLNILLVFILFISCNVSQENNLSTLNTDPIIQAVYKAKWLELVKDINSIDTSYIGAPDLYGNGAFSITLLFDSKGNLQNYCPEFGSFPAKIFPLHTIVENHNNYNFPNSSFLDEKTAIMFVPSTASPKLADSLYIVRISNNTIYRTRNASGFNHMSTWDGKTVDSTDLMIMGKKQ